MIILPAIDLKNGRCVRLLRGVATDETVYSHDPIEVAVRWREAGAEFLHVVDLDGAFEGEPIHFGTIVEIARETGMRVEVGGGIRSRDTVQRYLHAGVDRVIIGTKALESPDWLAKLCAEFPGQIVADVAAQNGRVAVHGWVDVSEMTALDLAARLRAMPLRAVVFTDVSRDGTLAGPALESTRAFAEAIKLPVIASGGVGNIEHIRQLAALPIEGIIIGKALYAGSVSLKEAIEVVKGA